MSKSMLLATAVCAMILGAGCNSTKRALNVYEQKISTGLYSDAVLLANERAEKSSSDRLMWKLLSANASSLQGFSQQAIDDYDIAEDIFLQNDKESVFAQTVTDSKAMVTNDRAFNFNGNGQERIFCCLYKALDYAALGNFNAARTEFNRAGEHQENWIFERRRDIAAAKERMEKDAAGLTKKKKYSMEENENQINTVITNDEFAGQLREKCNYKPDVSGNLDEVPESEYFNAYLAHMNGVFRWLLGDGGRNHLRDAQRLNPGNQIVASDLGAIEQGQKPANNVWIYIEDGLCPCREEWRWDCPLVLIPYAGYYVKYAGMALPYLRYRPNGALSYCVQADGQSIQFEELQNIDKLMKTEYDVYMRGAITREITRVILKTGAQAALGIAAENTRDRDARLSLILAQHAAVAWAMSTTSADLRGWTSLPKSVLVQRIQRPADGLVTICAGAENFTVNIPEGNSIVWVRKTSPAAGMLAKIINFK